ncbi:MAG: hypothetical protein IT462_14575 [Planctomycetes bacterium]|nr:hypothetical protein [Planctomycetota bacterium]
MGNGLKPATDRRAARLWIMFLIAMGVCLPTVFGHADILAQNPAAAPKADEKDDDKDDPKAEPPKEAPKPEPAGPVEKPAIKIDGKVTVGIYLTQVKNFSLASNEFLVEFWIWYRWKGDNFDPLKTMEIVNGKQENVSNQGSEILPTGENYAWAKVLASVKQFFDVARFPLDNHVMSIMIEDGEDNSITRFEPDVKNSKFAPDVQVPGWDVVSSQSIVADHKFESNLGDNSKGADALSTYSQFAFNLNLKRPGLAYFFKLFWSIFLATLIGFMALLVKPTDLDPRFGLGVGAIFAASASAYVINSALPPTNIMTLSDKINMLAIAFIFCSMLISVVSLRLIYMGKERPSVLLDRIGIVLLVIFYGIGNFIMVTTA